MEDQAASFFVFSVCMFSRSLFSLFCIVFLLFCIFPCLFSTRHVPLLLPFGISSMGDFVYDFSPTSLSLGNWFQQWVDPSYGSRFSQQLLSLSAHWPAHQGQPIHGSARQEFLLWFPDASSSFVFPMTALTSRSLLGQGTMVSYSSRSREIAVP